MEKSMNKEILEKLEEIVCYIEKSNTYQDYQMLKEKLASNQKITSLIEEVKSKQKELVNKKYHHENTKELEEELTQLEKKLLEIPLYCDFFDKQTELNDIFTNIKSQIEKCLDENIK